MSSRNFIFLFVILALLADAQRAFAKETKGIVLLSDVLKTLRPETTVFVKNKRVIFDLRKADFKGSVNFENSEIVGVRLGDLSVAVINIIGSEKNSIAVSFNYCQFFGHLLFQGEYARVSISGKPSPYPQPLSSIKINFDGAFNFEQIVIRDTQALSHMSVRRSSIDFMEISGVKAEGLSLLGNRIANLVIHENSKFQNFFLGDELGPRFDSLSIDSSAFEGGLNLVKQNSSSLRVLETALFRLGQEEMAAQIKKQRLRLEFEGKKDKTFADRFMYLATQEGFQISLFWIAVISSLLLLAYMLYYISKNSVPKHVLIDSVSHFLFPFLTGMALVFYSAMFPEGEDTGTKLGFKVLGGILLGLVWAIFTLRRGA